MPSWTHGGEEHSQQKWDRRRGCPLEAALPGEDVDGGATFPAGADLADALARSHPAVYRIGYLPGQSRVERNTDSPGPAPVLDDHLPTVDYLLVDGVLARFRVGISCCLAGHVDLVPVHGDAVQGGIPVCA